MTDNICPEFINDFLKRLNERGVNTNSLIINLINWKDHTITVTDKITGKSAVYDMEI